MVRKTEILLISRDFPSYGECTRQCSSSCLLNNFPDERNNLISIASRTQSYMENREGICVEEEIASGEQTCPARHSTKVRQTTFNGTMIPTVPLHTPSNDTHFGKPRRKHDHIQDRLVHNLNLCCKI